jgi:hypothetical protein
VIAELAELVMSKPAATETSLESKNEDLFITEYLGKVRTNKKLLPDRQH